MTAIRIAVDIVVQRGVEFLFIRRKFDPFKGELALPGGFIEEHESAIQAACRELREETSVVVQSDDLWLVGEFSEPKRDPRGRVISLAYFVMVSRDAQAQAGDDAKEIVWKQMGEAIAEGLAFDHRWILEAATA